MTTVLLTGATGYFGSHILEMLLKSNYSVIILKRSFSDTKRISTFINGAKSYDIDKIPIENVFDENKIDIIVHTATNYGRNNETLSEIIKTNLLFPLEILECAAKKGTTLFINTSTSLPDDLNYYEMTKKQFSSYAKKMAEEKGINFLNVKMEHMYGPGEDSSRFMPSLIRKILNNEKVDMTKGEQARDFIYIEDAIEAYSAIIQNAGIFLGFKEIEVGSGMPIKIRDLASTIKSMTGSKSILNLGAIPYRKNEPMYTCANISLLKRMGWSIRYNIESGLKNDIEYYRKEMTR
jgi:CDP-paratose synthetase